MHSQLRDMIQKVLIIQIKNQFSKEALFIFILPCWYFLVINQLFIIYYYIIIIKSNQPNHTMTEQFKILSQTLKKSHNHKHKHNHEKNNSQQFLGKIPVQQDRDRDKDKDRDKAQFNKLYDKIKTKKKIRKHLKKKRTKQKYIHGIKQANRQNNLNNIKQILILKDKQQPSKIKCPSKDKDKINRIRKRIQFKIKYFYLYFQEEQHSFKSSTDTLKLKLQQQQQNRKLAIKIKNKKRKNKFKKKFIFKNILKLKQQQNIKQQQSISQQIVDQLKIKQQSCTYWPIQKKISIEQQKIQSNSSEHIIISQQKIYINQSEKIELNQQEYNKFQISQIIEPIQKYDVNNKQERQLQSHDDYEKLQLIQLERQENNVMFDSNSKQSQSEVQVQVIIKSDQNQAQSQKQQQPQTQQRYIQNQSLLDKNQEQEQLGLAKHIELMHSLKDQILNYHQDTIQKIKNKVKFNKNITFYSNFLILKGQDEHGKTIVKQNIIKKIIEQVQNQMEYKIIKLSLTRFSTSKCIKQIYNKLQNYFNQNNKNIKNNRILLLFIQQIQKLFADVKIEKNKIWNYQRQNIEDYADLIRTKPKQQILNFIQKLMSSSQSQSDLFKNILIIGATEDTSQQLQLTIKAINFQLKKKFSKKIRQYKLKSLDSNFWRLAIDNLFNKILPNELIDNQIMTKILNIKLNFNSGIINFIQQKFVQKQLNLLNFQQLLNFLKIYVNQKKQKILQTNCFQSTTYQILISPKLIIQFFQNLQKKTQIQLSSLILGEQIILLSCYLYFNKHNDQIQVSFQQAFCQFEWICSSLNINLNEKMFLKFVQNLNSYNILTLRQKRVSNKMISSIKSSKMKNIRLQNFSKNTKIMLKISRNKIRDQFQQSVLFSKFFQN